MRATPSQQQGVALLTILIMVVLATILAMSIFKAQQATLDETKMLMRQNQALLYAQSAEYFFSEMLIEDAKNNDVDHLAETWAQPFPTFPIEDGYITGQVYDEHRKFNINNLLKEDGSLNEQAVEFFQNLLKRLDLDPQLVESFIDWQDSDEETVGAMGAENSYYQGLKEGYLAPNTLFSSVQQVQWLRGIDLATYIRLKPYITVLPARNTQMNLNSIDPLLLSAISEDLNVITIQNDLQQKRNNFEYFNQLDEIWELDTFKQLDVEKRTRFKSLFSGQSSYFTAEIQANLSQRRRVLTVNLYRQGNLVQVYQRRWLLNSEQP